MKMSILVFFFVVFSYIAPPAWAVVSNEETSAPGFCLSDEDLFGNDYIFMAKYRVEFKNEKGRNVLYLRLEGPASKLILHSEVLRKYEGEGIDKTILCTKFSYEAKELYYSIFYTISDFSDPNDKENENEE